MGDAYESVTVDIEDHVAQVTLVGPGKGNAMGPAFWAEMPEVFAKLDADRDVRAIVLTGSGKHFSYGLDLLAMGGTLSDVLADGGDRAPARGLPRDDPAHAGRHQRRRRLPHPRPSPRCTAGASAAGWT